MNTNKNNMGLNETVELQGKELDKVTGVVVDSSFNRIRNRRRRERLKKEEQIQQSK